MKKITKLTKKQKARIPEWVEKWVKIGLQTGEMDFEKFKKNIKICYEKAGLECPSRIIRVPSPMFGAYVASLAHEIWNKKY